MSLPVETWSCNSGELRLGLRLAVLGLRDVVMISLRDGPWRGDALALDAELQRRARGATLELWAPAIHNSHAAAEYIDELPARLLAGQLAIAPCAHEQDADTVEFHARIYAERPAH